MCLCFKVKHVISQATQEQYVCLWTGCKVHGRTSCSRSWLERHVLAHAGTKPFRCIVDGCGLRFNSQVRVCAIYCVCQEIILLTKNKTDLKVLVLFINLNVVFSKLFDLKCMYYFSLEDLFILTDFLCFCDYRQLHHLLCVSRNNPNNRSSFFFCKIKLEALSFQINFLYTRKTILYPISNLQLTRIA